MLGRIGDLLRIRGDGAEAKPASAWLVRPPKPPDAGAGPVVRPTSVAPARALADAPAAPLTDDQLGVIAVMLARAFPEWLQRRVDHVSYLDAVTLRHSEGVMLRWPEPAFFPAAARPRPGQMVYLPLDLLTKKSLTGLQAVTPDGTPVPILTVSRSNELAGAGISVLLWALSESRRHCGLSPDGLEVIATVVGAPSALAKRLLPGLERPTTDLGEILRVEPGLLWLMQELAARVLFLVPATYQPGIEVVYQYSFCEPLPWEVSRARVFSTFGWSSAPGGIAGLPIGLSRSYHLEVEVPGGVRLSRARLYGRYRLHPGEEPVRKLIAEDGDLQLIDLDARRPIAHAFDLPGTTSGSHTRPPLIDQPAPDATLAQMLEAGRRSSPTAVDRTDTASATFRFRPDPWGNLFTLTVVSVLTALLLLAARTRLHELDGATAATLLLAFPVLALGYLASPGEHSFATRLLRGPRFAALAIGMCALLVAGSLAGGFLHRVKGGGEALPHVLKSVVDGATIVAVVLALVLLYGWVSTLLRPTGRLSETKG